jgi:glycerophosphoryl diester phosphodiesterase
VELDVRLSADGAAVLLHDPLLADGREVCRISRSELGESAILEDALDLMAGKIVNVELKSDVPNRIALARAATLAVSRARAVEVVFSSFDPFLVLACAALAPRTPRGILVGSRMGRFATALPLALRTLSEAAHLEDALATPERVARLARAGIRTCVWTVNDPVRARALFEAGVGWIITDRPQEIVEMSREGGRVGSSAS